MVNEGLWENKGEEKAWVFKKREGGRCWRVAREAVKCVFCAGEETKRPEERESVGVSE